ncbi:MAG: single-stranded DNA-binding protein [Lentisphaeria bacterium]|nr:single-stranded DNA-binding protein [Lentisphaeria bacterium]
MANFNLNHVILGGRLTADPEMKTTPSGIAVTTFTVAVNRRFGGKNGEESPADFFTVTAWRATAEFICKFFRKASSICVVGSIQTRTWTDQSGQKHYATEIVADEAYFVDAKNEIPGVKASGQAYSPAEQTNAAPQGNYIPQSYAAPTEALGDEELPF